MERVTRTSSVMRGTSAEDQTRAWEAHKAANGCAGAAPADG